jgi:Pyridine nucleotide-disulphide oxidoreductase, dimerisation domain
LGTVGCTEDECIQRFAGDMDVYVSKFKPMKNTLSGREERTLMKMIVHMESQRVLGIHMVGPDAAEIMQVPHHERTCFPYSEPHPQYTRATFDIQSDVLVVFACM